MYMNQKQLVLVSISPALLHPLTSSLQHNPRRWISQHIDFKHKILGASFLRPLQLHLIISNHMRQHNLDLITCKEPARASILPKPKLHGVDGWTGELVLV